MQRASPLSILKIIIINNKEIKICIPGSGMVEIGLSGSSIPFWTSSSLLARTDIFRSNAVKKC